MLLTRQKEQAHLEVGILSRDDSYKQQYNMES